MTTLATVGSLLVNMRLDPSQFNKGAKQVESRSDQMRRRIVNGATVASTGIALAGVAALKVGDEYKAAVDSIRVGTGAVGEDLRDLEDSFQRVAGRVRESIGTTAQTMANLNTGLKLTGSDLEALTEKAIKFGRITGFDVANGTNTIIRLFGDWSVATERQGEALDKVFRAGQSTGIAVDHLMRLMVEFGAPMRQLGFSFDEAAAAMGKWQREGVNIEKIAAAMRIGLGRLLSEGLQGQDLIDEWNRRLAAIRDGVAEADAAISLFGSRNAADMIAALREGRFEFGEYVEAIANGNDTIDQAIRDTRTFADDIGEFINRIKLSVGPVTDAFAGIAEAMGLGIFLLPALIGGVVRSLTMMATSPRVLGAARAAGLTVGGAMRLGLLAGIGILAIPLIIELQEVSLDIGKQIDENARKRAEEATRPLEQTVESAEDLQRRLDKVREQRHQLEIIDFIFPSDILKTGAALAEARETEQLLSDRLDTLRRSLESQARGEGAILAGAFQEGYVSTLIKNARLPEKALPAAAATLPAPTVEPPTPLDFDAFIAGSLGNLRDRVRSSRGAVAAAMEDWKKSMDRPFRGFGKKLAGRIATVTQELKTAIRKGDPGRIALAADMLAQLQGEQTAFQQLKKSYKDRGDDILAEAQRTKGTMDKKGDAIVKALRGSARAQILPKRAMDQRGQEIVASAQLTAAKMFPIGADIGFQLAVGIESATPAVRTAAAGMGAAISDNIKTGSPAKAGPLSLGGGPEAWGRKVGDLFQRGLDSAGAGDASVLAPSVRGPAGTRALAAVAPMARSDGDLTLIVQGPVYGGPAGLRQLQRDIESAIRPTKRERRRKRLPEG